MYRFHSLSVGDTRKFLVYDAAFIDGKWVDFHPKLGGFWGIQIETILKIKLNNEECFVFENK